MPKLLVERQLCSRTVYQGGSHRSELATCRKWFLMLCYFGMKKCQEYVISTCTVWKLKKYYICSYLLVMAGRTGWRLAAKCNSDQPIKVNFQKIFRKGGGENMVMGGERESAWGPSQAFFFWTSPPCRLPPITIRSTLNNSAPGL